MVNNYTIINNKNINKNTKENANINIKTSGGVYKSHEPVFHDKYLRYPWNTFTSLFYLLPILYIPVDDDFKNYYGRYILFTLTPVSFFWWAWSPKYLKYVDNTLVMGTQIWLISYLLNYDKLNYFTVQLFWLRNDMMIRVVNIILSGSLLYYNTHFNSRYLFLLALLAKISDFKFKNMYGTALFHFLSSMAITSYFYHLHMLEEKN